MRYWWVNQNQTYRAEVRGSFMWSPKRNANGARSQFYENMREVSPGDVVFSFCDTRIKAVGVVTGGARTKAGLRRRRRELVARRRYVDQSISGVFYDSRLAREREAIECRKAREESLIVEDPDSPDGEWQVSWTIEEHAVG